MKKTVLILMMLCSDGSMDYFILDDFYCMRVSICGVGNVDRGAPLGRRLSFGDQPGKPSPLEKNPSVMF